MTKVEESANADNSTDLPVKIKLDNSSEVKLGNLEEGEEIIPESDISKLYIPGKLNLTNLKPDMKTNFQLDNSNLDILNVDIKTAFVCTACNHCFAKPCNLARYQSCK